MEAAAGCHNWFGLASPASVPPAAPPPPQAGGGGGKPSSIELLPVPCQPKPPTPKSPSILHLRHLHIIITLPHLFANKVLVVQISHALLKGGYHQFRVLYKKSLEIFMFGGFAYFSTRAVESDSLKV